jgi:hypothetical protein
MQQNEQEIKEDNYTDNGHPKYEMPQLYLGLIGGIVVTGIALFLILTHQEAVGTDQPGLAGNGGGHTVVVSRYFILGLGLIFTIVSILYIIKDTKKKD